MTTHGAANAAMFWGLRDGVPVLAGEIAIRGVFEEKAGAARPA